METNYYMDDQALVLDQTLISLKSSEAVLTVPASFGGHPVTVAGSGSLSLEGVQELAFAPGYAELNEGCLNTDGKLKRLRIPETVHTVSDRLFTTIAMLLWTIDVQMEIDRAMSATVIGDIRRNALYTGGRSRLLPSAMFNREELEPVYCLMRSAGVPAAVICRDMHLLFVATLPEDNSRNYYSGTIFDPRPCYDFLNGEKETEEYTAVMQMIQEGDLGWHDPEAEHLMDLDIRFRRFFLTGTTCQPLSTVICDGFPEEPGQDGQFHLRFQVHRRRLFFPALRYIRHKGADWWIYSRNYLSSNPDRPYLREDVGVFNRSGLITNRKTSEDVYAKSRFLSLL